MVDYKVAVITGATSGIGAAVAEKFAEEGKFVVLVGRSNQRGNALESKIKISGNSAQFIKCDVSSECSVFEFAKHIEKLYGRVDVLFNNAGIMLQSKELERLPQEEWKQTFDSNLNSIFYMTKHLKKMIISCKGCIINNGSIAGMHSYVAGHSYAYSASKAAIIQFTRQMALNHAEEGVRVNCICPGIVDTPILGDRDRDEYAKRVPLGYVGTPEDVANVVLFLASDSASYLTGVILPIDGGVSLN